MLKIAVLLTANLLARSDAHFIVPALLATDSTQVDAVAKWARMGGFVDGYGPGYATQYFWCGLTVDLDNNGKVIGRDFSLSKYFSGRLAFDLDDLLGECKLPAGGE